MNTSPSKEQPKSGLTEKESALLSSTQKPVTAPSSAGTGSIAHSAQRRTQIAKRESMAQAAQDAKEANRVYAQTFLTVLDAGTNEFTDSLTQHLGVMRESLLEAEDDAVFLAQLMESGAGGALLG